MRFSSKLGQQESPDSEWLISPAWPKKTSTGQQENRIQKDSAKDKSFQCMLYLPIFSDVYGKSIVNVRKYTIHWSYGLPSLKTNSSPLKMDGTGSCNFLLKWSLFRGHSFIFGGGYILIWKSVIFFSKKKSFETLTTDGGFGSIARWKTTKRHHMCQGQSTPYIGDGHPTFHDGNPYFMAI